MRSNNYFIQEYFFDRQPMARKITAGNLTKRFELKKLLKCHSFSWFIKNVHNDLNLEIEKKQKKLEL